MIRSLLPVGITKIDGVFSKGDILLIQDETGAKIGLGRAEYASKLTRSSESSQKNQKPLIHYDYLYLFDA
ncbi:MAG: PUA domain-containing protein [Arcicella sp.]|nr:PUA domain-containing protein [Arcicella sp.]